jgi:hypothetical protein
MHRAALSRDLPKRLGREGTSENVGSMRTFEVLLIALVAKSIVTQTAKHRHHGPCCTATRKNPSVCRLFTLQSQVPVKIAAPQADCGHNSTPEISSTIMGFDPIAG